MFEVYIIECVDGSLYTGYAKNSDQRFLIHLNGKGAAYTRAHKPLKIVYKVFFQTKSEAMKEEIRIKRLTRAEKVYLISSARNF